MTPLEAIKSGYVNSTNFDGSSSRSEFWWFYLLGLFSGILILFFSLAAINIYHSEALAAVCLVAALLLILPHLAALTRRLHDTNHSGLWVLLLVVPLIGIPVVGYWLCLASDEGANKYGEVPLGQQLEIS
jgi:uncharacterized membrane protein YhaH (DUF805 family)